MCRFVVNGMGTPGVLPPFTAIGLGTPTLANAYGSGIPSLGAFALASSGALGSSAPGALRGLSNVLLVSNLNEEVINYSSQQVPKPCLKNAYLLHLKTQKFTFHSKNLKSLETFKDV